MSNQYQLLILEFADEESISVPVAVIAATQAEIEGLKITGIKFSLPMDMPADCSFGKFTKVETDDSPTALDATP